MKVCVVTVTYGDRLLLLKQVLDACFREGVDKVIVVDNNSEQNARRQLKEYEEHNRNKVKVIYLDENTGSAGGFKRGLEEAYNDPQCEFVWLLDDDNKPLDGSLKKLLDFWDSLKEKNKEENIALLSYRFKKEQHAKRAILNGEPEVILGFKNSFLSFHIKELHEKIYRYFLRTLKIQSISPYDSDIKHGIVPVAPYGGVFIHKKILGKIGFPNEQFYTYADDHEWTYRITKSDGKIYLIFDSLIDDLELSWHISDNPKETAFSIIAKGPPFRIYYSIRNRVYFEINNLVDNKLIYYVNMVVYLLLIAMSSRKNFMLLIKAIKDGLEGNLGRKEKIL